MQVAHTAVNHEFRISTLSLPSCNPTIPLKLTMGEESADVKPKLNIVIDFEGQTCTVKVKAATPFQKIFEAAEKRFQKEPGTFKFTFDGQRIRPEMTPAELGMEDGDQIDAHLTQVGGRSCDRRS